MLHQLRYIEDLNRLIALIKEANTRKEKLSSAYGRTCENTRQKFVLGKANRGGEAFMLGMERQRLELQLFQLEWEKESSEIAKIQGKAEINSIYVFQELQSYFNELEKAYSERSDQIDDIIIALFAKSFGKFKSLNTFHGSYNDLQALNALEESLYKFLNHYNADKGHNPATSVDEKITELEVLFESLNADFLVFKRSLVLPHLSKGSHSLANLEKELVTSRELTGKLAEFIEPYAEKVKSSTLIVKTGIDESILLYIKLAGGFDLLMKFDLGPMIQLSLGEGSLHADLAETIDANCQKIQSLINIFHEEKKSLEKIDGYLKNGQIQQAESSLHKLTQYYNDLPYVDYLRKIIEAKDELKGANIVVNEIHRKIKQLSFFERYIRPKGVIRKLKNYKTRCAETINRYQGTKNSDLKKKVINELKVDCRLLDELIQSISRNSLIFRCAVFACLIAMLSINPLQNYRDSRLVNTGVKLKGFEEYGFELLLDAGIVQSNENQDMFRHYLLPADTKMVKFSSELFGDYSIPLNLEKGEYIDISTELDGKIKLHGKEVFQRNLNKRLTAFKTNKTRLRMHQANLKQMILMRDLGVKSLAKYEAKYPQLDERGMRAYKTVAVKKIDSYKKQLLNHVEKKHLYDKRLVSLKQGAANIINRYIIENTLLIPIIEGDQTKRVFEIEYYEKEISPSDIEDEVTPHLVIEKKIINLYENDLNIEIQADDDDAKRSIMVYLKNFPVTIESKQLRKIVRLQYREWEKIRNEYMSVESRLKKEITGLTVALASKEADFNRLHKIIEPLKIQTTSYSEQIPLIQSETGSLESEIKALEAEVEKLHQMISLAPFLAGSL